MDESREEEEKSSSSGHQQSTRTRQPSHQRGVGPSRKSYHKGTRQGLSHRSENLRSKMAVRDRLHNSAQSFENRNMNTRLSNQDSVPSIPSKDNRRQEQSNSRDKVCELNVNADCFYPRDNVNTFKQGNRQAASNRPSWPRSNTRNGARSMGCVVNGRYVRQSDDSPLNHSSADIDHNDKGDMAHSGNVSGQWRRQSNYDQNHSSDYKNNHSNYVVRNSDSTYNRGVYYKSYYDQRNGGNSYQDYDRDHRTQPRRGRSVNSYYEENERSPEKEKGVASSSKGFYDDVSSQRRVIRSLELMKPSANRLENYKENQETSTTQRDSLIQQLEKGECECMVCCERIKLRDYVWNCCKCFHIFHLRCIKKWARTQTTETDIGWRCPTCQKVTANIPHNYYCFCGRKQDPDVNPHYTPHSCGEMCGRKREDENCDHKCTLLCHPGPCPPCLATVNRSCECGKNSKRVLCSHPEAIICGNKCGKILNCGIHKCEELCHKGSCNPCAVILQQECYCRASTREVLCDEVTCGQQHYCCDSVCGKDLACGHHKCMATCHPGSCETCSLMPELVLTCPCGKTDLVDMYATGKASRRVTCIDPIPLCGEKCDKELPCGPKDCHHRCASECHVGECPPCPLTTIVKCQCSSVSKEITCKDLVIPYVFKCERRCNKRKSCGRHKCLSTCCVIKSHVCELVCNKKLSCGNHQCQEICHACNCPPCWNVSFDELRCHCGHSVLYPPIQCGTRPPECDQPCTRSHECEHKVQHSCHSDIKCPPCTVLCEKMCFGGHEKRSNVQCFIDGISCGKLCGKPLPCGRHNCREICHSGACLKEGATCKQPCEVQRSCGHPCDAPCHDGPCPESPCKSKVTVRCPCGFRSEVETCSEDVGGAYRLVSASRLAAKMNDIKSGETVNLGDIFGKKNKYNRLLCNEDCAIHERNKRIAVALQIQNPDLSSKPGAPSYSEFLKEEAKKNPKFVTSVYDKFSELVQLAKQSKQKSRSYAFPSMNRDQRRVVHEMAEFFGCETQSYDEEPVKNVVITAFRERSWLPFVSIAAVVEREMGIRRGPAPVISTAAKVPVQVSLAEKKSKRIDYFDFEG